MRPLVTLLLPLFAVLALAPLARAQSASNCDEIVQDWARACPDLRAACVRGAVCPPGSVILEAGCHSDDRLRVEVSHATPRVFKKVGDLGVSPVGSFPDWSRVAEGKRRVLDEVSACVAADPSLISAPATPKGSPVIQRPSAATGPSAAAPSAAQPPSRRAAAKGPPVPWRLLAGLALGALVCARRWRNADSDRRRTAIALALLYLGTLVLRRLIFPAAFHHMNGQGAFWIAIALDPDGDRTAYGPGYWELYGWLARLPFAGPEDLVLGAQAAMGALSPVCAWLIVREVGGSRALAWAGALLAAQSPILARISQSQSYYGTWSALLFVATAILLLGCPRKGERLRWFALSVLACGLVVAQAARVTPVGWVSAAVLPLAVLARPGEIGARLRWTVAAGLGIGAAVALTSGPAMLAVLRGALGAQWLPEVGAAGLESVGLVGPALLVAATVVLASRHRASAALRVLLACATLVAMEAANLIRAHPATFQRAFAAMWAPVLIALVAALVADLRARALRAAAAATLAFLAIRLSAATWREESELPTNVLEARWAEKWRKELPPGSTVVYLGRAGQHILGLPLYGAHSRVQIDPWVLTVGDPPPDLHPLGPNVHYYESSLCAAREARALCRAIRERHALVPIETRTLPARSSASTSLFEEPTLEVGLYRVQPP